MPDSITEELYKRNSELAIRNKTLLLLRELYQISILTLEPQVLAGKTATLIRDTLELELTGIYSYVPAEGSLLPLAAAWSSKTREAFKTSLTSDIALEALSPEVINNTLEGLISRSQPVIKEWLDLWPSKQDKLTEFRTTSHIRSVLAYPLMIEQQVRGMVVFGLNHAYGDLNQFERDSIATVVNVIAVALDRATLDEQLKIANERLKELDRQKTEFVSIASHQLRSPLTAIKGYSSMLLEGSFGPLDEKVRGAVERVFESSQRLVVIIEDFLNITRIELGKMKYEMTDFNFSDLAATIVTELRPTVEKKGLQLEFVTGAGDLTVTADQGKLSQVVSNLVDNAAKYTPQGSIKVAVERREDKVVLSICDTGVGIPAETLPKLFEKFIRADDAGKTNISGTGLGLFVAKQIIEGLGGRIWAESDGPTKGSRFYVELKAKA